MEGNKFAKDESRNDGFLAVCEYLEEHEDGIITVADLVKKMSEYSTEPYTVKWMKNRLLQHYDRQILIANKYGKKDVVIFSTTACDIFHDYHGQEQTDNTNEEKLRLLKAAADILEYLKNE